MNRIAAYSREMSELTERRAFIETFVEEIVVMPGHALMRYTIRMPGDRQLSGRSVEEMSLNDSVPPTVENGGPSWIRTNDQPVMSRPL